MIKCVTAEEFVVKCHGLKSKKHSPPLDLYVKAMDWKNNIPQTKPGSVPYYNGTLYGCTRKEDRTIRLKIHNTVMRDVVMRKPASEALNYKSDLRLIMDVERRITDKIWRVELMYAYSAEKEAESNKPKQPSYKKRKFNGVSAPQCKTGYVSVVKMESKQ